MILMFLPMFLHPTKVGFGTDNGVVGNFNSITYQLFPIVLNNETNNGISATSYPNLTNLQTGNNLASNESEGLVNSSRGIAQYGDTNGPPRQQGGGQVPEQAPDPRLFVACDLNSTYRNTAIYVIHGVVEPVGNGNF